MRFFLGLILLSALTTSCRSSSLKATEQTGQINIPNQQATATPSLFDQIINNDDELSPSYSFGSPVGIESLEITPVEYEIDHQYTLEDGEAITPLSGAINLWIFIRVKNIGANSASTDLIIELYYAGEVCTELLLENISLLISQFFSGIGFFLTRSMKDGYCLRCQKIWIFPTPI